MKKKIRKILKIVLLVFVVVLLGVYVFLSSPHVLGSSKTSWLTSTLIAHRGLHSETVPENSMAAFEAAVQAGYTIELDAQLTKDNQVVVLHDNDLNRVFDLDKKIIEMTYEELQAYTILDSDQKIPLLSDVIAMIDDQVPVMIEVKNDLEVGTIEGAIYEVMKNYDGRFAIIAFNPYSLEWFKNNAPNMMRGQISGHFKLSEEAKAKGEKPLVWYKQFMLSNLLMNFTSRPNFIVYEVKDTSMLRIISIKVMNVPLIGYTIDSQLEYDQYKGKYDNFMVNTVDLD